MTRHNSRLNNISVAPMMDWTDRHCRFFHRLLSPSVRLYTEMVTTGAIIYGDRERFLRFNAEEKPVALQLGGSNPAEMTQCAIEAEKSGFDEVNINCGCPSDRVQAGYFGAVLMKSPDIVAECVHNMRKNIDIDVTVKCRIAVDEEDEEPFLRNFIDTVSQAGCRTFIIHARKAWLNGLSPKENRDIPPLNYDLVKKMKQLYPDLNLHLNGGISNLEDVQKATKLFDGVMIGRAAYQNPTLLRQIEETQFATENLLTIPEIIEAMSEYACQQNRTYGTPVKSIAKHMTGLFLGQPGAKLWRQSLSPIIPERFGVTDPGNGYVLTAIYNHIWGMKNIPISKTA